MALLKLARYFFDFVGGCLRVLFDKVFKRA